MPRVRHQTKDRENSTGALPESVKSHGEGKSFEEAQSGSSLSPQAAKSSFFASARVCGDSLTSNNLDSTTIASLSGQPSSSHEGASPNSGRHSFRQEMLVKDMLE